MKNSFPSTERHVFVDNGMKNRVPSTERYVFVDNGMKNRVPSTERYVFVDKTYNLKMICVSLTFMTNHRHENSRHN